MRAPSLGTLTRTLLCVVLLGAAAPGARAQSKTIPQGPVVTPIEPKFPPIYTDLSIHHLEITQATQRTDGSLPAVNRRMTTVRMFVTVSSWLPHSVSGVQGRLRVYDGTTLLQEVLADNGPITAPWTPDRNNENHTLNFTFVPTGGSLFFSRTLTFVATVDPFNTISESLEGNNELTVSKAFACRRAPRIVGVPIDYQYSGAAAGEIGTPDPSLIEPGVGDAFVWGIYPFAEYTPGANGRYRVAATPLVWSSDIDTSDIALLNALEAQRVLMSPVPDYVYGWLRGNPYWGNGLAYVGGTSAFGNTDPARHQRTFAHELGHNFGFSHVGFTVAETGWDSGDRLGLGHVKSSSLYDIMVPALLTHQAWIHPDTYADVYTTDTDSCRIVIKPIKVWMVSGYMPPKPDPDPWRIDPVFEILSASAPVERRAEGEAFLRVIDAKGQELHLTAFDTYAAIDAAEGKAPRGFAVTTPAVDGAAAIEVVVGGKVQGVIKRSAHAPEVRIVEPRDGAVIEKELVIGWDARDADGDTLRPLFRFSPDAGRTFVALAPLQKGDRAWLPTAGLPGTRDGILQVLVSDGLNTTVAEVRGLQLERNQPPYVKVLQPRPETELRAGANLVLMAAADDIEDGTLADEQIVWTADKSGVLGYGPVINTTALPAGVHTVVVTAKDASGAVATDAVVVQVR